jgi:uncharacterized protein YktA (UPF0223 family)
MSRHWEPVFHPRRRPKPPEYRRIPTFRRPTIGEERAKIFDCWEFTYYYVYLNPDVPSQDRFFEVRIRIPLRKWQSPEMAERVVAFEADERMSEHGVNIYDFDKQKRGFRRVGTTKSKSGRYIIINKATKESWPKEAWGRFER